MPEPLTGKDLLAKLSDAVKSAGGSVTSQDTHILTGMLTAITSKWFLGGRKVTDTVTCRLVPEAQEVHLREVATETSWGMPPPTFKVEVTSQTGTRVTSTRTDTSVGGGGRLEFGKFREELAKATRDAGWTFVYDV
jgi:hypothetical protein